jgi:hypothetical protein
VRQRAVPFVYKGIRLSIDLRTDLIVEDKVIVDLKAKDQVSAIDKLKVLTYLRLLRLRLGLVINFHVAVLKDGIHRVVNELIDPDEPPEPADFRASAPLRLCVFPDSVPYTIAPLWMKNAEAQRSQRRGGEHRSRLNALSLLPGSLRFPSTRRE